MPGLESGLGFSNGRPTMQGGFVVGADWMVSQGKQNGGYMARNIMLDSDYQKYRPEDYQLHEIRFTRDQVKWCLIHIVLLRQGFWPTSVEIKGSSKVAYFRTPAEVAAEIDYRLKVTGVDGTMAELRYSSGESYKTLASRYSTTYQDAVDRVRNVIRYMQGWRRKRRNYKEFLNHRKRH